MLWNSVGKDLSIIYRPSYSLAANRKKMAQEEEREQGEASPVNRITFVKNENDRAVQIGLVAVLLVQYLFPSSLVAAMFPGAR